MILELDPEVQVALERRARMQDCSVDALASMVLSSLMLDEPK
jgi:hypothetical protein